MSANPLLCKKMPMKNFEDILVFCFEYDKYDFRREYFKDILNFINKKKTEILKETNQGLDHCFRINSLQFGIPTKENYQLLIDKYYIDKMDNFVEYEKLNCYERVYNPQMQPLEKSRKIGGGKFYKNDFMGVEYMTKKKEVDRAYPTAIIKFSNRKRDLLHPTQKPIALLEYLIKTYTNENDLVLDNCFGSNSTGVACVNTNRNYIGIEKKDIKYTPATHSLPPKWKR